MSTLKLLSRVYLVKTLNKYLFVFLVLVWERRITVMCMFLIKLDLFQQ